MSINLEQNLAIGELLQEEPTSEVRERFLVVNPGARFYHEFPDFSWWRLQTIAVRYVGGFGRMSWVEEELQVLKSPETYVLRPEDAWKRLKMRGGSRKSLAVLMEAAAWRERQAQLRDVPRNRVLKDDALYEVATQHPASFMHWGSQR